MIILSFLVNGNELPPLLIPLPVDEGVEPDEEDVLRDLERSRDDWPMSQCSVKSASGELEPGFVVPNAQMILSVVTVLTYHET